MNAKYVIYKPGTEVSSRLVQESTTLTFGFLDSRTETKKNKNKLFFSIA